ncbi:Cys-tRNA(Pro) deacylase [Shewanella sp. 5_MG-2023]|uniref:Cys-tRNA(Pro) deacylase n=1 Tax=unclassified Shewanella TaxID=196818 RepID=UPI000C827D46|nr:MULTISPECIES: Cys-tRNA(Pro) deacylase [unclassified Shewanella]MDO6618927.1 Cys-tRNA(Pro) deacylase [Shewanella sp. 6_MG-2023]MDO6639664.1 Cys-tRNA(Pro) deacylase [Shewanella sp. 5_MG-2023]PMI00021.1 aminoacyl-tRNA deacylase [Shewanella sp. 10N.286.48.A6]
MTPAINTLKKHKTPHTIYEYEHDSNAQSYGDEAVEKLGVSASQVFKTLVVTIDSKELAVAVVPMTSMLSLKLLAKALGGKKAVMADKGLAEKTTGYVFGGVSPLGQKRRLKTVINSSAKELNTMYVSAGRRGLEISLAPADLQTLTQATFANICSE